MRRFACIAAALLVSLARADVIDDLVKEEMEKSKSPALAFAVVKDGKVIRSEAYGIANLETWTPATPETVFRVASMSKQFCAAATMLLAKDGKLSVEDSVRRFLPDAPEEWEAMKIKHLLSHTSGMPDIGAEEGFTFTSQTKPDDYLKGLYKKRLKRKPGTAFEYSNPGYSVLGLIVGKVSGSSLEEVVTERIFKPLKMDRTRYYNQSEIVPGRAMGYLRNSRGSVGNAVFLRPPVMQGSGGIMSTVLDFAKWDAALYGDSPLDAKIKEAVWKAQTPAGENGRSYGYGWFITNGDGKLVLQHSGGTLGFTSNVIRRPEDKLTVIVLQNVEAGGAVALSQKIAEHYLKKK